MENVLGYTSNVQTGNVIAARNAALDLGEGHIALTQTFSGGTEHQVSPLYETGSSAIYMVMGNPSASFQCSSFISKDGFFAPFSKAASQAACGTLRTININLGSEMDCDPKVVSKATAKFTGAILQSLGFQVTAGATNITQSAGFVCGDLTVI